MNFSRHATLISAAAVAIATFAGPALGQVGSEDAWDLALSGRASEAFTVLEKGSDDSGALRAALERRAEHLETVETKRAERLIEAKKELAENLAEGETVQALRNAVEIHTLAEDKRAILSDPGLQGLVASAEKTAKDAEARGAWLEAYELYYRLNLLFEQDRRYREPFERIGRRLVMLRLYVPETLHDMRSARLVAQDEDPLPAYNGLADDWGEKLEGVSQAMLIRALNRAERSHVDRVDLKSMLTRGLETLRTFVTTTELSSAFPSLTDARQVARFIDAIEEMEDDLADQRGKAGYFELVGVLKGLNRANERTLKLPEEALLHEFGNGAMGDLDEFSTIYWPDEVEQLQRSTQGKFTGVGIKISSDESQAVRVITPLQGTPAQRAGVLPGDLIVAVDGDSTMGISLEQAVDRITGDEGTPVTLSLEREGVEDPIELTMTRAEIPIHSVKGWRRAGAGETDWDWFIDKENKIGMLRVTQFAADTTRELRRAVREMRRQGGVNGVILDLRYNPGGLVNEAVSVANLFIKQGVIVSQHDADGVQRESEVARPSGADLADVPVVVLINEGSASASEIVSGCLQDYDRAIIVGARSFGKGSVQNVYTIGTTEMALLKLTTQYYYLPSGRLIHRKPGAEVWGVQPDVEVEMLPSQIADALIMRQDADLFHAPDDEEFVDPSRLISEGVDTQLETALLLLQSKIASAPARGGDGVRLSDRR